MNAENLHDAIGELPMEMLKEVDAYRGRKIIPWQRYISLAACLAVILGSALLFRMSPFLGGKVASENVALDQAPAPAAAMAPESAEETEAAVAPKVATADASLQSAPFSEAFDATEAATGDSVGVMPTLTVTAGKTVIEILSGEVPQKVTGEKLTLSWAEEPNTFTVKYWEESDETWHDAQMENQVLIPQPGEHTYEVVATWDNGKGRYVFFADVK